MSDVEEWGSHFGHHSVNEEYVIAAYSVRFSRRSKASGDQKMRLSCHCIGGHCSDKRRKHEDT